MNLRVSIVRASQMRQAIKQLRERYISPNQADSNHQGSTGNSTNNIEPSYLSSRIRQLNVEISDKERQLVDLKLRIERERGLFIGDTVLSTLVRQQEELQSELQGKQAELAKLQPAE